MYYNHNTVYEINLNKCKTYRKSIALWIISPISTCQKSNQGEKLLQLSLWIYLFRYIIFIPPYSPENVLAFAFNFSNINNYKYEVLLILCQNAKVKIKLNRRDLYHISLHLNNKGIIWNVVHSKSLFLTSLCEYEVWRK